MFEINMSGRGGMASLKQGRQKILPLLGAGLISLGGSLVGGLLNNKARKDAQKNAYKATPYEPGLTEGSFGQYNPTPYDFEQLQGILSGNYQVDPAILDQLNSIAEAGKRMGKTDEEIQQAQLQHYKKMQAQADVYEKGLSGAYGEMAGIDPRTGKPVEGSFDPRSQASISGFKYLAPVLAGAQQDAEARRRSIEGADVDDVTKARLRDQVASEYYKNATKAREDQMQAGLSGLGNLYSAARGTQAPGLSGGYGMAAQTAGTAGNLQQGMAGLGLQQDLGLANYANVGQQYNNANTQWGLGRSDANRLALEGNRLSAWGTQQGINSGAYQNAMAGAGQPGNAVGALAGTLSQGYLASRAPSGAGATYNPAGGGMPKGR